MHKNFFFKVVLNIKMFTEKSSLIVCCSKSPKFYVSWFELTQKQFLLRLSFITSCYYIEYEEYEQALSYILTSLLYLTLLHLLLLLLCFHKISLQRLKQSIKWLAMLICLQCCNVMHGPHMAPRVPILKALIYIYRQR